jgi:hypothetical protein
MTMIQKDQGHVTMGLGSYEGLSDHQNIFNSPETVPLGVAIIHFMIIPTEVGVNRAGRVGHRTCVGGGGAP